MDMTWLRRDSRVIKWTVKSWFESWWVWKKRISSKFKVVLHLQLKPSCIEIRRFLIVQIDRFSWSILKQLRLWQYDNLPSRSITSSLFSQRYLSVRLTLYLGGIRPRSCQTRISFSWIKVKISCRSISSQGECKWGQYSSKLTWNDGREVQENWPRIKRNWFESMIISVLRSLVWLLMLEFFRKLSEILSKLYLFILRF